MADDDTVLDDKARMGRYTRDDAAKQREQPEFRAGYDARMLIANQPMRPSDYEDLRNAFAREREHPLVHAWRHSANMWRDRFHRQEQLTFAWKWVAIGLAVGYPLGICAYRLLP